MKLKDAMVICHWFPASAGWFRAACKTTRRKFAEGVQLDPQGGILKKLDQDVWAIDGCVPLHKDKTKRGFRVLGLVLINQPELMLVSGNAIYPLQPGTVYHIDGRASHGALLTGGLGYVKQDTGLFAFMAWDVHADEDFRELVDSIPEAMQAFAAGVERVDVSTAARPL